MAGCWARCAGCSRRCWRPTPVVVAPAPSARAVGERVGAARRGGDDGRRARRDGRRRWVRHGVDERTRRPPRPSVRSARARRRPSRKKLADLRKSGDGGTYSAVKAAKERGGGSGGFDLLEALADAEARGRRDARADHGRALLRALAHAGTTPAVRQLVLVGVRRGRRAPARARAPAQGAWATARSRGSSRRSATRRPRRGPGRRTCSRAWASARPGDAVQTKDNQALADVLHAYANIKDLDALPVVLSFVNSDRVQVRSGGARGDAGVRAGRALEAARGLRGADGRAGAGRASPRSTSRRSSSTRTTAFACRTSTRCSTRASRRRKTDKLQGRRSRPSTRCSPGSRCSTGAPRWRRRTSPTASRSRTPTARPRSPTLRKALRLDEAGAAVEPRPQRDRHPRGRGPPRPRHRRHRALRAARWPSIRATPDARADLDRLHAQLDASRRAGVAAAGRGPSCWCLRSAGIARRGRPPQARGDRLRRRLATTRPWRPRSGRPRWPSWRPCAWPWRRPSSRARLVARRRSTELDERHRRVVAAARAELDDARVAARRGPRSACARSRSTFSTRSTFVVAPPVSTRTPKRGRYAAMMRCAARRLRLVGGRELVVRRVRDLAETDAPW